MNKREISEDYFLAFQASKINFVLPVLQIQRIVSEDKDSNKQLSAFNLASFDDLPIVDWREKKTKQNCIIILDGVTGQYGLKVTSVQGIIDIKPEHQYSLPQWIQDETNAFIMGVTHLNGGSELYFLLDPIGLSAFQFGEV